MKCLGIDYGEKRVGLSIGDTTNKMAVGKGIITNHGWNALIGELQNIIKADQIRKIVLGLPVDSRGKEGTMATKIKNFGRRLGEETNLPIEFENERYSTEMVEDEWQRAGAAAESVDQGAAIIILQSYFDRLNE